MVFIIPIIVGVIGMLLGVKIGIERLAKDLLDQNRINLNEHAYITSI